MTPRKRSADLSPAYRENYTFTDEHGKERRRARHPQPGQVPVYDLDVMTRDQLTAFIEQFRGPNIGPRMFPSRPIGCKRAAVTLYRMAYVMRKAWENPVPAEEFERMYSELPPFAQWRRQFQPLACLAPGQRFKKAPRKSSAARLLNLTQEKTK